MNKIIRILVITFSYYSVYAGIGAQFNIDNDVKATVDQKTQEDTSKQSPSGSPRSILRRNNKSQQKDGWFLGLLKCLQT